MMTSRKRRWAALLALLPLALAPGIAHATLGMSLVESPAMGLYFGGGSGRQWVIGTDGSVTGPDAADYISGAAAARFSVTDDASPASIVILVDNITTAGGFSWNTATCSYDGGADTTCDGAGMTATSAAVAPLNVGFDVTTTQVHGGNDLASVSFDVTISYL